MLLFWENVVRYTMSVDRDQLLYLQSLVRQDRKRSARKALKLKERFGEVADMTRADQRLLFVAKLEETLRAVERPAATPRPAAT